MSAAQMEERWSFWNPLLLLGASETRARRLHRRARVRHVAAANDDACLHELSLKTEHTGAAIMRA